MINTIDQIKCIDMIVNKPEGLEKEQLCAALLIAEIHETSQIIT